MRKQTRTRGRNRTLRTARQSAQVVKSAAISNRPLFLLLINSNGPVAA